MNNIEINDDVGYDQLIEICINGSKEEITWIVKKFF